MDTETTNWWFKHYSRVVCSSALLSEEEELAVAKLILGGDAKARERMICANMRLVLKIAMQSVYPPHNLYDLAAEGTKGLIDAVDRFDPSRKVRFATYATHWIKQSVRRHIKNNTGPLRTPIHTQQQANRLTRIVDAMTQTLGRKPLTEEIAVELGMDSNDVERILNWRPSSIDLDAESSEGFTMGEIIPEANMPSPFAAYESGVIQSALKSAIDSLKETEKEVVIRRFGLDGKDPESLTEIGDRRGLTGERIRQIQEKALRKLRNAGSWPKDMFAEIRQGSGSV